MSHQIMHITFRRRWSGPWGQTVWIQYTCNVAWSTSFSSALWVVSKNSTSNKPRSFPPRVNQTKLKPSLVVIRSYRTINLASLSWDQTWQSAWDVSPNKRSLTRTDMYLVLWLQLVIIHYTYTTDSAWLIHHLHNYMHLYLVLVAQTWV